MLASIITRTVVLRRTYQRLSRVALAGLTGIILFFPLLLTLPFSFRAGIVVAFSATAYLVRKIWVIRSAFGAIKQMRMENRLLRVNQTAPHLTLPLASEGHLWHQSRIVLGFRSTINPLTQSEPLNSEPISSNQSFHAAFRRLRPARWNLDVMLLSFPIMLLWLVNSVYPLVPPVPLPLILALLGCLLIILSENLQSNLNLILRRTLSRVENDLGVWSTSKLISVGESRASCAYKHKVVYRATPWFNRRLNNRSAQRPRHANRLTWPQNVKGDT